VVEVQMVAFAENLDELLPMLAVCHERLGVDLNVMGMYTYGAQEGFVALALRDDARRALSLARDDAARRGMWRARASLDALLATLGGSAARKPCLVPWYSAMVSTDGDVYPCCHHTVRGVCVGNALREGFSAVWNSPAMTTFRAGLRANRCGDRTCASCPEHDAGLHQVRRALVPARA
jgi:radical SAM protein with 4Fe4S-binding SPASM domain